jgi:hypothetical protein
VTEPELLIGGIRLFAQMPGRVVCGCSSKQRTGCLQACTVQLVTQQSTPPAWLVYVSVLARVILAADKPRSACANTVWVGPLMVRSSLLPHCRVGSKKQASQHAHVRVTLLLTPLTSPCQGKLNTYDAPVQHETS